MTETKFVRIPTTKIKKVSKLLGKPVAPKQQHMVTVQLTKDEALIAEQALGRKFLKKKNSWVIARIPLNLVDKVKEIMKE